MRHKWLIASILIIVELGLCAAILPASVSAVSWFRQVGIQIRFLRSDAYSAEADEERTFTVSSPARLVVSNSNGAITVQPGTENAIVVHIHKKAWGSSPAEAQASLAALQSDLSGNGNTVTVNPPVEPEKVVLFGSMRSASTDLIIRVPVNTTIQARNSYGDITLSGTVGDAELRTSAGSIDATNVSGNLQLRTQFGDISVDGANATLQAETDLGDIKVTNGSLVNLDLDSKSGSLDYSGSLGSGPHTLRTRLGSIRLNLPQASALTFDLDTNLGQLHSAFPTNQSKALGNNHLSGTINAGGAQLTARTNNGDINLGILNP